ncbi:hypothetical protein FOL47_000907 [Perkinsus chesapeaki]|uniref:Uncharacterized protein n=1 Tax=Perkinsus chesapeaki TaxID=330153 RepID=A0A7J6N0U4_PERCH|nr:hypothetical protein FOL47_000907 [Perkinsus chesapeaki]
MARVFHIVDSLTEQEAEADLGAVKLTIQEWLTHHRLDDFISEVQVINVEFESAQWASQASVRVSHAGDTLRRSLALPDLSNISSTSLGRRHPRSRLVMEDIELEFEDLANEFRAARTAGSPKYSPIRKPSNLTERDVDLDEEECDGTEEIFPSTGHTVNMVSDQAIEAVSPKSGRTRFGASPSVLRRSHKARAGGAPGAIANMQRSLLRRSNGKAPLNSHKQRQADHTYTLSADRLESTRPACQENIARIEVVNRQMVLHSSGAGMIITNLFDVPKDEGSLAYMQLVELFCDGLEKVLLVRGNVSDEWASEALWRQGALMSARYILGEFERVKAESNPLSSVTLTTDPGDDVNDGCSTDKKASERQFIYLNEIRNLRAPEDVTINFGHMAILWKMDSKRDGVIDATELISFADYCNDLFRTYGSHDFKEYLQAHCVMDMYHDVFASNEYNRFSDWLCHLVSQGEKTTTFSAYPGVKFMTRDAVYHLHTFLQQYHVGDFRDQQGFLDLLQEVSERMELMTLDDEHLDDYVPVATIQLFSSSFAHYTSSLQMNSLDSTP